MKWIVWKRDGPGISTEVAGTLEEVKILAVFGMTSSAIGIKMRAIRDGKGVTITETTTATKEEKASTLVLGIEGVALHIGMYHPRSNSGTYEERGNCWMWPKIIWRSPR